MEHQFEVGHTDIAHSVSRLQSMVQDPTVSSLNEAYRVAAYVHSTASFKLGGKVVAGQKYLVSLRNYCSGGEDKNTRLKSK